MDELYSIATKACTGASSPCDWKTKTQADRDTLLMFLMDVQLGLVDLEEKGWFFKFLTKMRGLFLLFPREKFRQQEFFTAFAILLVEADMIETVFIGLDVDDESLDMFQEQDECQFLSSLLSITGIKEGSPMFNFLKPIVF